VSLVEALGRSSRLFYQDRVFAREGGGGLGGGDLYIFTYVTVALHKEGSWNALM